MDERMARKIGELKAFCMLGEELFQRGASALETAFGKEKIASLLQNLAEQEKAIDALLEGSQFKEAMNEKALKTKDKIGGMAQNYIGDARDDATELCEWLGFFEGAAVVHFSLVYGKAEKAQLPAISEVAKKGMELHQKFLGDVTLAIQSLH